MEETFLDKGIIKKLKKERKKELGFLYNCQ
jgi:hypothetical protein